MTKVINTKLLADLLTRSGTPNFGNTPSQELIQDLSEIKAGLKKLEQLEGLYTEALVTALRIEKDPDELKMSAIFGEHKSSDGLHRAVIEPMVGSLRLNADKVKAYVGHDEKIYQSLCAMTNSKGYKLSIKDV